MTMTRDDLLKLTCKELKEKLAQAGLKKGGKKAELVARLLGEEQPTPATKKVPRWGTKACKGKPLLEWMIIHGRDRYVDGHLQGQEVPPGVIHQSCEEFKIYDKKHFETNCKKLREVVAKKKAIAEAEAVAIKEQMEAFPPAQFHIKGVEGEEVIYPRWSCHVAQKLLRFDIQNGCLDHKYDDDDDATWFSANTPKERMCPELLWHSRPAYQLWPLKVFRDHIYQEIKAMKQHQWNLRHGVYGIIEDNVNDTYQQ